MSRILRDRFGGYATYLKNTKEYLHSQAKYSKGEQSIQSAANIVGLNSPKEFHQEEKEEEGGDKQLK